MIIYKIKRLSDGLFSTGGMCPRWKKTGKTWAAKNHLTAHLSLVHNTECYDNCVVMIYEYKETDVRSLSVDEFKGK